MIDDATFWWATGLLALGTFLIRFSFLGFLGDRTLPPWALLHLKFVGVSVLPALVAPLVLWPPATGGDPDAPRLAAALAALIVGWRFGLLAAVVAGMGTLYALQAALGG